MTPAVARAALDEVLAHRARTAVLATAVAVAVVAFAVMTELASAGRQQLDTTVERTQGRAGTVLVTMEGFVGTDVERRAVPHLAEALATSGAVDVTRLSFYEADQFACPPVVDGGAVGRIVLVDGPLGSLVHAPAASGRDWSAFLGDGTYDEPCRSAPTRRVTMGSPTGAHRLGLVDGDLLYEVTSLDPIGPASDVVLAAVMADAQAADLQAAAARLEAISAAFATAVGVQRPTVTVRRVDTAGAFRRPQEGLATVLHVVAAGALALGGLAVLAVQLMAVSARTRILALYRAVGARRSDLRSLVLLETVIAVTLGAATGALACRLSSPALSTFALDRFGAPVEIAATAALVRSSAAALLVGVIAGLLPARRAARLDVVAALDGE